MTIKYLDESAITDVEYFRQVLADADELSISLRWGFDEQQADPFHHNFTGHEFFRRLRRMVEDSALK